MSTVAFIALCYGGYASPVPLLYLTSSFLSVSIPPVKEIF